jgi:hypothetical protein
MLLIHHNVSNTRITTEFRNRVEEVHLQIDREGKFASILKHTFTNYYVVVKNYHGCIKNLKSDYKEANACYESLFRSGQGKTWKMVISESVKYVLPFPV